MARSLFRQILLPLVAVALLSGLLFGLAAYWVLGRLYAAENERAFRVTVDGLAAALPPEALALLGKEAQAPGAEGLAKERTQAWVEAVATAAGLRLTLIAPDGRVVLDSSAEAGTMENHGTRPEVAQALAGKDATAQRVSATLGSGLYYAAAPLRQRVSPNLQPGPVLGALRIAADLPSIKARVRLPKLFLILYISLLSLAVAGAAALFSRRIAKPLGALAEASRAVAQGDRTRAIPAIAGPSELRILASGLSSMSTELQRRVHEAESEGQERMAILDGMAEAVLALDKDLCLRMANPAARALFALPQGESILGKSLLLVARSTDLETAARTCLETKASLEVELALYGESERWFQAFVTPLSPSAGDGLVVVLNDITKLRRLERVRKDFVANVSHELRTPIQLIKGFLETLNEEGFGDEERSRRFLGIMGRNAARMESLIDDLLTLARLEQEGSAWLKRETLPVALLLDEALAAVSHTAEAKGISLQSQCEEGLEASLNAGLFVQALVNLLDNGVKYSPEGRTISLRAGSVGTQAGPCLRVEVQDQGFGIPARDLPRIFERFYRVDKARSRAVGGTGLGLAIVRHVALAHGGEVGVESFEGEGSTFSITLPLRA